jgi:hypothetical protein
MYRYTAPLPEDVMKRVADDLIFSTELTDDENEVKECKKYLE